MKKVNQFKVNFIKFYAAVLNKFGDFIHITDVNFSSPNIILVSFIETYYFIYNNLAEFFLEYLVRDTKGFLNHQCIYSRLNRAGLLFFKWKLDLSIKLILLLLLLPA